VASSFSNTQASQAVETQTGIRVRSAASACISLGVVLLCFYVLLSQRLSHFSVSFLLICGHQKQTFFFYIVIYIYMLYTYILYSISLYLSRFIFGCIYMCLQTLIALLTTFYPTTRGSWKVQPKLRTVSQLLRLVLRSVHSKLLEQMDGQRRLLNKILVACNLRQTPVAPNKIYQIMVAVVLS